MGCVVSVFQDMNLTLVSVQTFLAAKNPSFYQMELKSVFHASKHFILSLTLNFLNAYALKVSKNSIKLVFFQLAYLSVGMESSLLNLSNAMIKILPAKMDVIQNVKKNLDFNVQFNNLANVYYTWILRL